MLDKKSSPGAPSGIVLPEVYNEPDADGDRDLCGYDEGFREGYREAAKRGRSIFESIVTFILESPNRELAIFQVSSGLGLPLTAKMNDKAIAARCRVTSRAAVSRGRKAFQNQCGIKPLPGQKPLSAIKNYARPNN